MSVLIDIADAVVSELNSRNWNTDSFSAIRQNIPRANRADMANLHVTVVPKTYKRQRVTRDRYSANIECFIGIQKGLKGDTNGETDDLVSLGELIADYFHNGIHLAAYPSATCVDSQFGDTADNPWLAVKADTESLLYTGIILVQFELIGRVP
jgi:hypothetical protein